MQLTIIPNDNLVIIDGRPEIVDCTPFPELVGVHAVQWSDDHGHIEFVAVSGEFKGNEEITSIEPYEAVIDAWNAAATVADHPAKYSNASIMGKDIKSIIGE